MTIARDQRRLAKLAVTMTERDRRIVEGAITFHRMRRGQSWTSIKPAVRGEVLVAICMAWMAAEVESMRGN